MVQHSDTGGRSMSKAKCYYVSEDNIGNILQYMESDLSDLIIGDSFDLIFSDFQLHGDGKMRYVLYAFNNGNIFYRNEDGEIVCNTMVISKSDNFNNWIIVCTDDEAKSMGVNYVENNDYIGEIYLSDYSGQITTKGSDYIISIDVTTGATSDSFASYGSVYSPTVSCDMFSCSFADALIAGQLYHESVKGSEIFVWYTLEGLDDIPMIMGRFVVKEEPQQTEETVSFRGIGITESYLDRAIVDIKKMNESHYAELKKKYVDTGYLTGYALSFRDDLYFWEFLPQDFIASTGIPLYIEDWDIFVNNMWTYHTQQLAIPCIEEYTQSEVTDDDGNVIGYDYDTKYTSKITWRELLSGIAILLRGNVVERNGAFYINRMPDAPIDYDVYYHPVFDKSCYESSSQFGNQLMCPSTISVKANNWWFYVKRDQKNTYPIGFGYYQGDSTVVINSEQRNGIVVKNYPVTIECPWILFETKDRVQTGTDMPMWFDHLDDIKWQTHLSTRNSAFCYNKAMLNMLGWFPSFYAGNMISVEDYDGIRRYVYIGEMTIHYDGSVYTEIISPCEVSESNQTSCGGSDSSSYNNGQMAQSNGTAMGMQLGVLIKDSAITNSKIADSTITGSKIAESTIDNSNIKESTITGSKFEDGTIENSKIKDSTLTGAKIEDATIGFEKVNTSFIEDLTADKAYIDNLTARIGDFGFITADSADLKYATIELLQATDGRIDTLESKAITTDNLESKVATLGYLSAESADVKFATIESLTAVDGKIDTLSSKAITTENISAKVAELGYLSAESAEIGYAKIDFSNVGTQVVSSSMIIDGAVTNEKVANLSANKITSGTIDASKITVTNLNADNITVGTINGQRIGNGSLSLDKLAEEVPTKEYLDNVEKNLQGQIDGAIETFTKSEIPTLNNEPANAWTDNATRKKHIGDVCYVLNPASSADGYCYRFANTGTEASPSYEWVLIKDSDVTKALQEIIDINGDIDGIKRFDEDISSWKKDTDDELSSLKLRTTTLETDMGSKVESSVFNELKQTVDENSSTIRSVSETVTEVKTTANEAKTTADEAKESASGAETAATNSANSANSAAASATKAESSAKSASNSATSAAASASNAEKSASSSATSASNAEKSAENSATEAANAKKSADTASANSSSAVNTANTAKNTADSAKKSADESATKVTTLTNTVNSVKQTADKNTLSISSMQTEIGKKADGSTVTELSTRTSKLEQNLDGFKTEVSKKYTTKTEFDNLEIKLTTNLLKPTLGTTTVNGVTCTNNGDGTYTLNGTATNYCEFLLNTIGNIGKIKLTGSPSSGITGDSWLGIKPNNEFIGVIGSDTIGDLTNNYNTVVIYCNMGSSFNNAKFKPMITTNLNATYDDFVPYTGSTGSLNGDLASNHKLTETVKTIAEQTADKFSWLVKSGTSATNFELTDRTANLVANHINLNGLVTFSGLGSDAKSRINTAQSTADTAKSNAETANSIIANWCYNNNKTFIDGGKIYTGSITSKQIDVDDLFAQDITATNLTISGNSNFGNCTIDENGDLVNGKARLGSAGIEVSSHDPYKNTMIAENGFSVLDESGSTLRSIGLNSTDGLMFEFGTENQFNLTNKKMTFGSDGVFSVGESSKKALSIYTKRFYTDMFNDTSVTSDGIATTSGYGMTKLIDSYTSTSMALAPTANAVNSLYGTVKAIVRRSEASTNNSSMAFTNNRMYVAKINSVSSYIKMFGGVIEMSNTSSMADGWKNLFTIPSAYCPTSTVQITIHVYDKDTAKLAATYAGGIYSNGVVAVNGAFNANGSWRIVIPCVMYI